MIGCVIYSCGRKGLKLSDWRKVISDDKFIDRKLREICDDVEICDGCMWDEYFK